MTVGLTCPVIVFKECNRCDCIYEVRLEELLELE